MPLWRVWYPENAWSADDKEAFSKAVTKCYSDRGLPPFYVVVIYTELGTKDSAYVGGVPKNNFVRITVDQIARDSTEFPMKQQKEWLDILERAIAPWVKDRGFDWEIHIDSTPRSLWRIQGIDPPESGSEGEKLWFAKNAPVPLNN